MSSSELGRPRNLFDTLRILVKSEKDDTILCTENASYNNNNRGIPLLIKPEANDLLTSNVQSDDQTDNSSNETVSSIPIHDGIHVDNFSNHGTSIYKAISSVKNDIQTPPYPSPGPSQTVCISNVIGASADFTNPKYKSSATLSTSSTQNSCFSDSSVNHTSDSQVSDFHAINASSRSMTIIQETHHSTHHFPSVTRILSTDGLSELYNDDPVLQEYIHKKCTLLRYPVQLALAMSKLCSPSNLFTSGKQTNPSDHNQSSSHSLSDHGYMEIDASHFTLNPSAILAKNDSVPISNMYRPRTKAQLRHLNVNKPSYSSEKTKNFTLQSKNKISQSKESQQHTLVTNESDVIEIMSDEEEKCGPSESYCKGLRVPKSNQLNRRSHQFCKDPRKTTKLSTPYRSQVAPNYKWKLRSMEDSVGLRLVSSLDFDRDPEAKFSQTPQWVYTYTSKYEKGETKTHLLLGDVLRILYLLLVHCKNQLVLRNVLKHCRHYCRRIPLGDIHICTSTGLSPLRSISLPHYSCTVSKSTPLFIVHWHSDNILKEILSITYNCLLSHETWYDCCPKMLLHTLSYLIFKPDAKKRILNFSKTFSVKSRQMSNAFSLLPMLQTNQNDSTNNLSLNNLHGSYHDMELYTKLFNCLPKSLTTILKTNVGLPVYHIAAFGLLINSFHNTCIRVFTDSKPNMHYNFNVQVNEKIFINLFIIMKHLHQAVSVCLGRLRDSYASLMSAGACLKARYELSKTHCNETEQLSYLRIARGRARLFESEAVAGDNIGRIFNEEVNPHIHNLINLLERIYSSLRLLTGNTFLFGPFYNHNIMSCDEEKLALLNSKQWVIDSLKYMEKLVHLAAPIPKFNFSVFIETSFRLLDYLTSDVTRHLHSVSDKVLYFKSQLSQTYTSITNSWIPAYKGLSTEVNSRADIDLTYFFSSLQSQYDVIEFWTRRQHETELRYIAKEMMNLLKTLAKCCNCQLLHKNLKLPCSILSIPYGSKNNSSHSLPKEPTIIPLSSWPPVHPSFIPTQHIVQKSSQVLTNQDVSSLASDSQEFVYSKLTFSHDTSARVSSSNLNTELSTTVNINIHKSDACNLYPNNNFVCETLSSDRINIASDPSVKSPEPRLVSCQSPSCVPDVSIPTPDNLRPADSTTRNSTYHPVLKHNSNSLNTDTKETSYHNITSFVNTNSPLITDVSKIRLDVDLIDMDEKSSREADVVKSCDQNVCKPYKNHPAFVINNNESENDTHSVDGGRCNVHSKTNVDQDHQITIPQNNDPLVQNSVQTSLTPTLENAIVCDTSKIENECSDQSSVVINHLTTLPEVAHVDISNSLHLSTSLQDTCNEHVKIPQCTSPSISDKDIITGNSTFIASLNDIEMLNSKFSVSQPSQVIHHSSDSSLNEKAPISGLQLDLTTSSNLRETVSMSSETICDHEKKNSTFGDDFTESNGYLYPANENANNVFSNPVASSDMCKNQPKEKSIKKVCIYLPDNAINNSPTEDIVSQCNNERTYKVPDEPENYITSLDRRRVGKLKRRLKKVNHSIFTTQTSSDMSDTSQITLITSSEKTSKDIQITHSVNNIESLAPWLKEKSLRPIAPGPVTASILGQSVPVLSDISIDLTVDD
ncbi:unnamed protein product [Schistosoma turkestanicum]|nr:unnamed protein product [Schistosoma turkestanicum]